MLKEKDWNKLTQDILQSVGDQGKLSDLLATVDENYKEALATVSETEQRASQLEQLNNSLRDTNHKLFLRVGVEPERKEEKEEEEENQKLDFENLFDENGFLK